MQDSMDINAGTVHVRDETVQQAAAVFLRKFGRGFRQADESGNSRSE